MLYRTKFGRAVRASLQNRTAADLIGINVNRVRTIVVGIGVAITAVGGLAFGATNSFNPNSGYDLISRLLAIVILGGMGSIGGAMVAAVFLLVINDVVAVAWSPTWAPLVFFAALVIVLSFRPAGPIRPHGGARPVSAVTPSRAERRRQPGRAASAAPWSCAGRCRRLVVARARFPLVVTDPTATSIAVFTLIFMVATTSWNVFSGYSGYLALGHAVFFGMRRLRRGPGRARLARQGRLGRLRPAALRRPDRWTDRHPGRVDRAAHPPPHLRGGDDRDLLHLPVGRVQPRLHRRNVGHQLPLRPLLGRPTTTSPSTTWR